MEMPDPGLANDVKLMLLSAVIDGLSDGVVILDSNDRVLYSNRSAIVRGMHRGLHGWGLSGEVFNPEISFSWARTKITTAALRELSLDEKSHFYLVDTDEDQPRSSDLIAMRLPSMSPTEERQPLLLSERDNRGLFLLLLAIRDWVQAASLREAADRIVDSLRSGGSLFGAHGFTWVRLYLYEQASYDAPDRFVSFAQFGLRETAHASKFEAGDLVFPREPQSRPWYVVDHVQDVALFEEVDEELSQQVEERDHPLGYPYFVTNQPDAGWPPLMEIEGLHRWVDAPLYIVKHGQKQLVANITLAYPLAGFHSGSWERLKVALQAAAVVLYQQRLIDFKEQESLAWFHAMRHVLKGPITSARNRIEGLLDDLAKGGINATTIVDELAEVKERLLMFQRADAKLARAFVVRPVFIPDTVHNLVPVLRKVVEELGHQSPKAQVEYHGPSELWLLTDVNEVGDVVMEVAQNALEMEAPRVEISLSLALSTAMDCGQPPDQVVIDVLDTGPGIPAEILDKIFEPRFTFGKDLGTGSGLSYCRAVMAQMGGSIKVYSHTAGQTCLRLQLPLRVSSE